MRTTSNFKPQTSNYVLSIISGILLALAFPKFNLWLLAWVALVPFFYTLNNAKSWRASALNGLCFGLVFFGINLFWVTTLFRFVGWWAVGAWLCLTLFQALFIVLFSIFYSLLSTFKLRIAYYALPITISLLWVAFEYLRSAGPFGVTAGDLGYTQVCFLPLIQIASFTTVYGVSFLVGLVNAAITALWPSPAGAKDSPLSPRCGNRGKQRERVNAKMIFIGALFLVIASLTYGIFELRGNREVHSRVSDYLPKLALIQPNIDQFDKMNPSKVREVFAVHEKLTRFAAGARPEIIVWPETAIFTYFLHDPSLLPRLKQLAIDSRAWLIVGTPHYEGDKIYNSMVAVSPKGEIGSRYDKERLVPFGEYLPFRNFIFPFIKNTGYLSQDFDSNKKPQQLLVGKHKIAAAICFESTFPGLIGARVGRDSDFILTITNDAWFDNSSALYFHLTNGIFRAIENRKCFVQVGNSGFSAVIDPWGRVLKKSNLNKREVLLF